MTFKYDYELGTPLPTGQTSIPIKFEVEGKNATRATVGFGVRMAFINLNFDYNIAKYPSATAGFMINLGW